MKGESMIYIGMNRVVNPNYSTPVTTSKIDNKTNFSSEVRINVEFIHIKGDSFIQTCYKYHRNNKKIGEEILNIINTSSMLCSQQFSEGGLIVGTVEEVENDSIMLNGYKIKEGDKVLCDTLLTAVAIHLDEILEINCELGDIYCKGYAVAYENCILSKIKPTLDIRAAALVFDKFCMSKNANEAAIAKKSKSICLITKDPINTYIYLKAIKINNPYAEKFFIIMDNSVKNKYKDIEKTQIFNEINKITFLDIGKPLESYNKLIKINEFHEVDYVLLTEDISGGEFLAFLLCKENGNIFFSTIKNNYINVTLNENIKDDKIVNRFSFYTLEPQLCKFALLLAEQIQEGINKYYKLLSSKQNSSRNYREGQYIDGGCNIEGFVFKSKIMANKVKQLVNVAKYDCNVIIEGETGTGKEMAMEIIHSNSIRAEEPCIKINCAAIQESLAESEFFGYEKGSFTGALANGKEGYFSMANNGILFLDEIDKLSISIQSKLLRVIQENSFYKVGGTEQINVNVRIVCASNKSLKKLVAQGKFREDLFYRLNIATVYIPPLKGRVDDIECLTKYFLEKYNNKYGTNKSFDHKTLNMMQKYDWPGNVRELENTVHRLVIAGEEEFISTEILTETMGEQRIRGKLYNLNGKFDNEKLDFNDLVKELEKQIIKFALNKCGTTRKAAEYLNMSHTTLIRKKNNYGIHQEYQLNKTIDYRNTNSVNSQ